MVVCEVVAPELVVPDVAVVPLDVLVFELVPEVVAAVVEDVESSSDSVFDELVPETVAAADLVLAAAAVWVVVALWSCHASTPPRDSMAATLSAAAALRALAARGSRFPVGRVGTRRGVGVDGGVGAGVCSSMR